MAKTNRKIKAKHNRTKKQLLFASSVVSVDHQGDLPKCRIIAYSGGKFEWDWKENPLVADLSTATFAASSIPLLHDHWDGYRVGHTTRQVIENNRVILEGVISGDNETARQIVQESKNGFPWQASIGAKYDRIEFYDVGEEVEVNGRVFSGPIEVARGVTIYETSFVVFGADSNTASQVFAKKFKGGRAMTFSEYVAGLGYDESTISDEVREALQKAFDNISASDSGEDDPEKEKEVEAEDSGGGVSDEVTDIVEDIITELEEIETVVETSDVSAKRNKPNSRNELTAYRKKVAEENKRIAQIHKICAGKFPNLEAKAIEEGWNPVVVENRVLKAREKQNRQNPSRSFTSGNASVTARVIEASALISAGVSPKFLEANGYDQKVIDQAETKLYRGMGLQRIIAMALECGGERLPSGLGGAGFYSHAVEANRRIRAAGGGTGSFSTISLPGILSNIANKSLLQAYESRESTLMRIASKSSHADFKGMTEYRLGADGRMKKIGQDGKIESITLAEESYFNQLETLGAMISLTRQMIINDDLSAFTSIPTQMGQLAFDTREMVGWKTLLDSLDTFFTNGRGNRIDATLSIDGISEAEMILAEQKNSNGMPISVKGRNLIVPPRLYPLARTLYTSMTVNETTATGVPSPVDNPHVNAYEPIEVPHFGAAYGGSNTQWMMISDPAQVPIINVAFLNGAEAPIIEESDSSFDTLGYQYRIYMDFGVAMQDYRGAVYSDGTAADSDGTAA